MLTQRQFDVMWADRTARYAISYDDAAASIFAHATRPRGPATSRTDDVWYALVNGVVIEGYDNGCHHASWPCVHGRRFDSIADAYAALATESRLSGLRKAVSACARIRGR